MDLDESPERLAAYRALALEYPRRFAELLEKAQADAGVAADETPPGHRGRPVPSHVSPVGDEQPITLERMTTVAEFAEVSRLSRPTIYRLIDKGDTDAIKISGTIRIRASTAASVLGGMVGPRPAPSPQERQRPQPARATVTKPGAVRPQATESQATQRKAGKPRPVRSRSATDSAPVVHFQPSPFAWTEDDQHG